MDCVEAQDGAGARTAPHSTIGLAGRSARIFLIVLCLAALAGASSGCNFFGKKKDEAPLTLAGQLSNGATVIGTWSMSYASPTTTRNPSNAFTETYSFDPLGSAQIDLRDPHNGGIHCTGYGQYRTSDRDVFVYVQAVSSAMCPLSAVIHLASVQVTDSSLRYVDPESGSSLVLFRDRSQQLAPAGLWDFHAAGADDQGNGGIDWIFLDVHGYFLMQTTLEGEPFLLIGRYDVAAGAIQFTFILNMDPASLDPNALVFSQFATDGQVLQLSFTDAEGTIIYQGDRL